MTCFSSELAEEQGQASVEAAALLPAVSLLVLLLLQPLCCAYSEMVMREAAAETARAAVGTADEERLEEFCRRRLAAIPGIAIFSDGDWDIEIAGCRGRGAGCDGLDCGARKAAAASRHNRCLRAWI